MAVSNSVLIVDDTPNNLQVLGEVLERDGFSVRVAVNGRDAMQKCLSSPPDLILLDILMPGQDGYEVCQMLKAHPKLSRTPILFISAVDSLEQKIKAFEYGGSDYITKPFHEEEVLARVRAHIRLIHVDDLEQEVAVRTAELQASNESLDAFCASISHDLRTPACNVVSLCDILRNMMSEKMTSEEIELFNELYASADGILSRVNALLAISRLEREKIARERFDFSKLAEEISQRIQAKNPERQVEWKIEHGMFMDAVPLLITEVMENLMGNAWKYTMKKSHAVIRVFKEWIQDQEVFGVEDNGAGFSMEHAQKLFQIFQRLHASQDFPGDGIGLATVKKIIQHHGGQIWAEAEIGKGATFRFTVFSAEQS